MSDPLLCDGCGKERPKRPKGWMFVDIIPLSQVEWPIRLYACSWPCLAEAAQRRGREGEA